MSDVNSVDDKPDLTGHVEGNNGTIQELINKDQPNGETIDEDEKSKKQEELSIDEKNNVLEDTEEKIQLGEQLTRNIADTGGQEMQISNDGILTNQEETISRKVCPEEESDAKTAQDSPMPSCSKTTDEKIIKEEKQGFSKQSEEKTQDVNSNIDTDLEKEDKSRISLAFESTRKFIAWVAVGKIGPGNRLYTFLLIYCKLGTSITTKNKYNIGQYAPFSDIDCYLSKKVMSIRLIYPREPLKGR